MPQCQILRKYQPEAKGSRYAFGAWTQTHRSVCDRADQTRRSFVQQVSCGHEHVLVIHILLLCTHHVRAFHWQAGREVYTGRTSCTIWRRWSLIFSWATSRTLGCGSWVCLFRNVSWAILRSDEYYREARIEFGDAVASRLKLTKDGTKVLWPQPADDPNDPQNVCHLTHCSNRSHWALLI